MPKELTKTHADLDRAVDRCYWRQPFQNDRQRVEHLFALYEKLTAPLIPGAKKRRQRKLAGGVMDIERGDDRDVRWRHRSRPTREGGAMPPLAKIL